MTTKLSEEQKYSIIEAVYRYVGDDFDMDEYDNVAIKFDSQDLKLLDRIERIIYQQQEVAGETWEK